MGSHPDLTVASIFADATTSDARDTRFSFVFVNPVTSSKFRMFIYNKLLNNKINFTDVQLPHTASSTLTSEDDAIFVLAYPSSDILLVRQNGNGGIHSTELKHDSIMPRFIAGIAEKFRLVLRVIFQF